MSKDWLRHWEIDRPWIIAPDPPPAVYEGEEIHEEEETDEEEEETP